MFLPILLAIAAQAAQERPEIRTTVPLVLVPTTVTTKDGKLVAGLIESDFELFDGMTLRRHSLEVTIQPISIVVCVQTNTSAGPALAKLVKIGSLILPMIAGETGAAAIVTYSDSVTVKQHFTSDTAELTRVFRSMRPNGAGSRQLDAVVEALRMLDQRDPRHRKVILVVGETRDRSSDAPLQDVLLMASRSNVTIYPVSFSTYLTSFTSRGEEHFGDPKDPKHLEQPRVYQAGQGMNLIGGIVELARLGKPKAADALARTTGGERFSFLRLKALEEMFLKVGEDLHNQYLLSFTPASGDPGYREIRVKLKDRADLTVRTRPGYWLGQ
jgi:VWFA-related protein